VDLDLLGAAHFVHTPGPLSRLILLAVYLKMLSATRAILNVTSSN